MSWNPLPTRRTALAALAASTALTGLAAPAFAQATPAASEEDASTE